MQTIQASRSSSRRQRSSLGNVRQLPSHWPRSSHRVWPAVVLLANTQTQRASVARKRRDVHALLPNWNATRLEEVPCPLRHRVNRIIRLPKREGAANRSRLAIRSTTRSIRQRELDAG